MAVTSAAGEDNPEVAAARAAGIPVLRRRELLGALMAGQVGIAVAGTHGKTTTTALLVHALCEAGLDPTYIIGGVLRNTGSNAGVGRGPHFVIEADEYDRMFLGLRPQMAIITNIEHDHPDCYPTLDDVRAAFAEFAALLPDDGLLVVCAEDAEARALGEARRAAGHPVAFYGFAGAVGETFWRASDLAPDSAGGTLFTVWRGAQNLGRVRLALAGRHNVLNALAVMAAAEQAGVPFTVATGALGSFLGTGRRAEVLGVAGGVTVISDYAHHPTAVRVTLEALRARPGLRDLWAVWQPHTYGRMRALAGEFAAAFVAADHVLVTDVYSVREAASPGLDAAGMAGQIAADGHPDVRYTGSLEATAQALIACVQPGDAIVLLSAGDAPQIGRQVLDALSSGEGQP
ncbi:MAG: UDP-N-acetylmuramate--L-alanine ligase [Anaerolineae bacterium]|nr:UDP-N-acetylmuramate--L-alanine ligase [Anaerolineae bacterium]